MHVYPINIIRVVRVTVTVVMCHLFIFTESSKKSTKVFTDNALVNGLLVGAGAGLLGSLVVGKIINDQQQKCVYRYKRDGTGSARSVTI